MGKKKNGNEKQRKVVLTLTKEREEKSINGKWVSLSVTVKENDAPIAKKTVEFFSNGNRMGSATTNGDGCAKYTHLFAGGSHMVTAHYENTHAQLPIEVETCKRTEGAIFHHRKTRHGAGKYITYFQVLAQGKPVSGATIRVSSNGSHLDLVTDSNGEAQWNLHVQLPRLTCAVDVIRFNIHRWLVFFNS